MLTWVCSILIFAMYMGFTYGACCPDTWVAFQDSCYLFGHQHPMTFVETEHFCRQHNAHIVNVGSSEENAFLKDTLKGMKDERRWIGLNDEIIDRVWRWYDTDEKATFFDWYPGEPNGGTVEDCVVMTFDSYQWADYPCSDQMQAICEMSSGSEAGGVLVG